MKENNEEIDLLDLLQELLNHIFLIISCTVVVAIAGYCYAKFAKDPVYESNAQFIVNARVESDGNITNDNITSASKLTNTYSNIIRSHTVLDPVIANLGLNMTADELQEMISMTSVTDTQLMELRVTSTSKALAYEICEEIYRIAPELLTELVKAGTVGRVVDPVEAVQVGPSVKKYAILGGLLAFVIVSAIIIARSMLNNKVRGESDITEGLGLSVLGVIPIYDGGNNNGK